MCAGSKCSFRFHLGCTENISFANFFLVRGMRTFLSYMTQIAISLEKLEEDVKEYFQSGGRIKTELLQLKATDS